MQRKNLHSHHHEKASKNLLFVFFMNLSFNIIVIVGALMTNSIAILADCVHDLADTTSMGVAWILEKVSQKDSTEEYTYGYKRYSLIGALITSGFVIIISFFVFYEAILRILHPVQPDGEGMLIIAIIGIIFKSISVWKLGGAETFNEKVISFHLLSDIFEWVAILVLSLCIIFFDVKYLDPFISIAISIWLLYNIGKAFFATWRVLLQKIPDNIDFTVLKKEILDIEGVNAINDIHLWSIDGIDSVLTVKLSIDNEDDYLKIKNEIKNISEKYHIIDITVEYS